VAACATNKCTPSCHLACAGEIHVMLTAAVHPATAHSPQEVPSCLRHLSSLRCLNLEYNSLVALPAWLSQLADLELLELAGNQLEQLPASIGSLRGLKQLQLGEWQVAVTFGVLQSDAVSAAWHVCSGCMPVAA
jgi:hypothetical protein